MTTDSIIGALTSRKAALLIGAGVSRQAGVPLVSEIVPAILRTVEVDQENVDRYLRVGQPFEVSMQTLSTVVGLDNLLEVFEGQGPQRNHHLFARLAAAGQLSTVITTNFDTLLEQAAQSLGYDLAVHIERYLSQLPGMDGRSRLLKLHGCLTRKDALGTTISAVANQRATQARYESLLAILEGDSIEELIVMGYSFSDRFDISPALERLRLPVRVTVIEHCDDNPESDVPLSSLPDTHPLRNWNGYLINRDTDALIKEIWHATQPDDPPEVERIPHRLSGTLASWRNAYEARLGAAATPVLAASLLKVANLYAESNEIAESAIELLRGDPSNSLSIMAHQIIGDNFRDLSSGDRGYPYLQDALKFAHRCGATKAKAKAINSLGIIREDRAKKLDAVHESDRPQRERNVALKYYDIGRRWALDANDLEQAGKCEGNMGIALKNVASVTCRRRAFRHLRAALELARIVGDPKSEARYYGMMASCVGLLGKKAVAMGLWEKALKVSRDIADHRHIAIWTANSGEDLIGVNNAEARLRINEAIQMFDRLKCPREVDYCQELLGRFED